MLRLWCGFSGSTHRSSATCTRNKRHSARDCAAMAWVLSAPWPGSFGKRKCCVTKHLYGSYKSEHRRLSYLFFISLFFSVLLPPPCSKETATKVNPSAFLCFCHSSRLFHFYTSHSCSSASLHNPALSWQAFVSGISCPTFCPYTLHTLTCLCPIFLHHGLHLGCVLKVPHLSVAMEGGRR